MHLYVRLPCLWGFCNHGNPGASHLPTKDAISKAQKICIFGWGLRVEWASVDQIRLSELYTTCHSR